MIPDLPLLLGIAAAAVVAILLLQLRPRRRRGRRSGGCKLPNHVDPADDIPIHAGKKETADDAGLPAKMQTADDVGLPANEVRRRLTDFEHSVDRHAEQVLKLRSDVKRRLQTIEGRLRVVEQRTLPPRESASSTADAEIAPAVEIIPIPPLESGVAVDTNPGAGGRPVEVRDGVLVISQSLPPAAWAVVEGPTSALVYLNDAVEINEFALPKWQSFFEMRGARPYATYRTVRPAHVRWDAAAERGEFVAPGVAEAV